MRWRLFDQLLKARVEQDISAREMGRRMNVSKTSIRRWENCIQDPCFIEVLRMAEILGLTLELTPVCKEEEQ
jgi:transcriptional regulator with XRE-family HTH domain